jgi:hypothetical protein
MLHIPRHPQLTALHMDIPLFIRLEEYAREDAGTDMDLHKAAENAESLKSRLLTMKDYKKIVRVKGKGKGKKGTRRRKRVEYGGTEDAVANVITRTWWQRLDDIVTEFENATGLGIGDVWNIMKLIYKAIKAEDIEDQIGVGKQACITIVSFAVTKALQANGLYNKYTKILAKELIDLVVGYIYDQAIKKLGLKEEKEKGKGTEDNNLHVIEDISDYIKELSLQKVKDGEVGNKNNNYNK